MSNGGEWRLNAETKSNDLIWSNLEMIDLIRARSFQADADSC